MDLVPRPLSAPEEAAGELVCEFGIRIVALGRAQELRDVGFVHPCQVPFVEGVAELPEVRARPDLLYRFSCGRVVLLEAPRVVAREVYPRAEPIRREPYLEERAGQSEMVHLPVEPDKPPRELEPAMNRQSADPARCLRKALGFGGQRVPQEQLVPRNINGSEFEGETGARRDLPAFQRGCGLGPA